MFSPYRRNVFTELFPSNGCCTVACLHNCYLAMGLHVTLLIMRSCITVFSSHGNGDNSRTHLYGYNVYYFCGVQSKQGIFILISQESFSVSTLIIIKNGYLSTWRSALRKAISGLKFVLVRLVSVTLIYIEVEETQLCFIFIVR
jgi:hypothetical protein